CSFWRAARAIASPTVPVRWPIRHRAKSPTRCSDSIRNLRDVLRVRANDLRGFYREQPELLSHPDKKKLEIREK
ncbi:hypothetical protein HC891_11405, partial [Candidatus Gracilibacteria bacterium]|nr:hypothetical protein [Candidatus Gracilibacteria bacterium]